MWLAGPGWGGEHCWRRSEDKARHSPGHAWATRLDPDLNTAHTRASGPTGSYTCMHTHTPTQRTSSEAHTFTHCRCEDRTGTHRGEIHTVYNWERLQKEEENHNKSTQGCMRLNRPECLKGDSKSGFISGKEVQRTHLKLYYHCKQPKISIAIIFNINIIISPWVFTCIFCVHSGPFWVLVSAIKHPHYCILPYTLKRILAAYIICWLWVNTAKC